MNLGVQPIFEDHTEMITGNSEYVIAKQLPENHESI